MTNTSTDFIHPNTDVPLHAIREKIEWLRNVNWADLDFRRRYVDKIAKTCFFLYRQGYSGNHSALPVEKMPVFRCRINGGGGLYESIRQLWYPPAAMVRMNRANFKGDPVFYGSNQAHIALAEVQPAFGNLVTLMRLKLTSKMLNIKTIGLFDVLGETTNCDALSGMRAILEQYMHQEFTKSVGSQDTHNYLVSALLSTLIIQNDFVDGIAYKSVAAEHSGINFALKPSYIDSQGVVDMARVVEITEYCAPLDFEFTCRYAARRPLANDKLEWEAVKSCGGHRVSQEEARCDAI